MNPINYYDSGLWKIPHLPPNEHIDWYGDLVPTGSTLHSTGTKQWIEHPNGNLVYGPEPGTQPWMKASVYSAGQQKILDNMNEQYVSAGDTAWAKATGADILSTINAFKDNYTSGSIDALKQAAEQVKAALTQANFALSPAPVHYLINNEACEITECDCDAKEDHSVSGLDYDGDESYVDEEENSLTDEHVPTNGEIDAGKAPAPLLNPIYAKKILDDVTQDPGGEVLADKIDAIKAAHPEFESYPDAFFVDKKPAPVKPVPTQEEKIAIIKKAMGEKPQYIPKSISWVNPDTIKPMKFHLSDYVVDEPSFKISPIIGSVNWEIP